MMPFVTFEAPKPQLSRLQTISRLHLQLSSFDFLIHGSRGTWNTKNWKTRLDLAEALQRNGLKNAEIHGSSEIHGGSRSELLTLVASQVWLRIWCQWHWRHCFTSTLTGAHLDSIGLVLTFRQFFPVWMAQRANRHPIRNLKSISTYKYIHHSFDPSLS